MVIRKARDSEVAMIVTGLIANHEIFIVTGFLGRGGEVLGQELAGLVEVVGCALSGEGWGVRWVWRVGKGGKGVEAVRRGRGGGKAQWRSEVGWCGRGGGKQMGSAKWESTKVVGKLEGDG